MARTSHSHSIGRVTRASQEFIMLCTEFSISHSQSELTSPRLSWFIFSKSLPRAWALITAKIFMYMRIFPIWACRDCFFGFNTQSPREAHEIHTKHMHLFGGFKLKNFEKHKRSWKKHYSARKNATSSNEGWTKNAYERVFKSIFFSSS